MRQIELRGAEYFQFTYRYSTNDQVKNYTLQEAIIELESLLLEKFRAATLFTLSHDLLVFVSKKKKISYKKSAASFKNKLPETHDKPKEKRAELGEYLHHLGITDKENRIIPKMADKYRQINKYLDCLLYTSPSPRDGLLSRMPSSA